MENIDNLHDKGILKSFKCMWWDYFYREMSKWSEKKKEESEERVARFPCL